MGKIGFAGGKIGFEDGKISSQIINRVPNVLKWGFQVLKLGP
jgi:hypothetical protein